MISVRSSMSPIHIWPIMIKSDESVLKSNNRFLYASFIRFLGPLVLTMVIQELGKEVLNGGMTRMPQVAETLAVYGLAWGVMNFLNSALMQTRQLGLVLVDGRAALGKNLAFASILGLILSGVMVCLGLTPLGVWVIDDLHGVGETMGGLARSALLGLSLLPLLQSLAAFYLGLLIRFKRTDIASYAVLASIAASLAAVFGLLPTAWVRAAPIRLPLLVTWAGMLAELTVSWLGYRRCVRPRLSEQSAAPSSLSMSAIWRFFWPLALIMAVQGFSRPLINLMVSRGRDGTEALAVLTVVYALGHLPYGWLNDLRNLPASFQDTPGSLASFGRFVVGCGLFSWVLMLVLFGTPLRDVILGTLIGVEAGLLPLCKWPLLTFTLFPLVVMVRAYLHGIGLLERRTRALTISGPARVAAIVAAMPLLAWLPVSGATRAVMALLCGFVVETAAAWWGLRGQAMWAARSRPVVS